MKAAAKKDVKPMMCLTFYGISLLPNCFFEMFFSYWDLYTNNAPMTSSEITPKQAVQNCIDASLLVYLEVMYRQYTVMLSRLKRTVNHFVRFDWCVIDSCSILSSKRSKLPSVVN